MCADLPAGQREKLTPFFERYNAKTSDDFGGILDTSSIPSNDYLGAIEVALCAGARLFFASSSTMSAAVINARHGTTGIMETEIDTTSNFRLTRLTRDWKQAKNL